MFYFYKNEYINVQITINIFSLVSIKTKTSSLLRQSSRSAQNGFCEGSERFWRLILFALSQNFEFIS